MSQRRYNVLTGQRTTPSRLATDVSPQPASNNSTADSRCASDKELRASMKTPRKKELISQSNFRGAVHITPPPETCTVLLPTDPGEDLTELIHSCGFDLVYPENVRKLVRKPVA